MRKRFLICLLGITLFAAVMIAINAKDEDKEPEINTPCTNAKSPLALPNSYGDDQATHPKAVSFDTPWNGYKYWLTFTPYCYGHDDTENPHILASNDLVRWEEPNGFKNPLEPIPEQYESRKCYNSDSHLVYNQTLNRLECWWRYVDDISDLVIIYRKWTDDGVHWSDKEILQENTRSVDDYLSPSVIYEDGIYKIWTIGAGYKLRYWESADGSNWQHQWAQSIRYPDANLSSWHVDVIHTQNGYEVLVVAYDHSVKPISHLKMSLYYLRSDDNYNYSPAELILSPTSGSNRWDNRGLYRSALMYDNGTYYLFYSAIKTNDERHVGLISGTSIFNLR